MACEYLSLEVMERWILSESLQCPRVPSPVWAQGPQSLVGNLAPNFGPFPCLLWGRQRGQPLPA